MKNARENLAFWASLIGCAIALLGVAESQAWLALLGISWAAASATTVLFLKRNQRLSYSAKARVEGLGLDSLLVANVRRRLNRSLVMERAVQVAIIEGTDLNLAWQYEGFCRSSRETSIDFSIDSENNVPFEQLDCLAFDLQNDPVRLHKIRPTLIGSDGVSKKVSVSFLQPLGLKQRFNVLLNCKLPGCITTGVQYYTSSLSFAQRSIASASVHLIFVKGRPEWLRVYEYGKNGAMTPISELRPFRDDGETCEYIDTLQNVPGQSVRVYLYLLHAEGAPRVAQEPQFRHTRGFD
jgi:hypothetical protein